MPSLPLVFPYFSSCLPCAARYACGSWQVLLSMPGDPAEVRDSGLALHCSAVFSVWATSVVLRSWLPGQCRCRSSPTCSPRREQRAPPAPGPLLPTLHAFRSSRCESRSWQRRWRRWLRQAPRPPSRHFYLPLFDDSRSLTDLQSEDSRTHT